ncbi:unnamed protein product, partial [Meganyctiphanes norvegica]
QSTSITWPCIMCCYFVPILLLLVQCSHQQDHDLCSQTVLDNISKLIDDRLAHMDIRMNFISGTLHTLVEAQNTNHKETVSVDKITEMSITLENVVDKLNSIQSIAEIIENKSVEKEKISSQGNILQVASLEENIIEAVNRTSVLLQREFQEIHNYSAENVTETNKSCLAPFEKSTTLGCVYLVNTQVSWRAATVECMAMGAQLMLNPPRAALMSYITDKGYASSTRLWIGGKHYDNWRWLNGDIITEGWAVDEPDGNQSTECVYFNYHGHGLLYDNSCETKKKFICEIP